MEEELLVSRVKTDTIQLALQAIMSKLEVNMEKTGEESEANFVFAEEDEAPSLSAGQARVKPTSPSDFDGDREKGRAFINTCHIYFSICRDSFKGDQAHIHWALSFFKSDQAFHFATKVMHSEQQSGRWHYKDWPAFEKDFEELFCMKNEQLTALTKLEGTSWYQGKDLVKDYID